MVIVLSFTGQSLTFLRSSLSLKRNQDLCKILCGFLVNSGDHDLNVPFLATQAWVRSLNYSIIDNWRPWMIKDQIGGYIIIN